MRCKAQSRFPFARLRKTSCRRFFVLFSHLSKITRLELDSGRTTEGLLKRVDVPGPPLAFGFPPNDTPTPAITDMLPFAVTRYIVFVLWSPTTNPVPLRSGLMSKHKRIDKEGHVKYIRSRVGNANIPRMLFPKRLLVLKRQTRGAPAKSDMIPENDIRRKTQFCSSAT